jgi:hypothetical protein
MASARIQQMALTVLYPAMTPDARVFLRITHEKRAYRRDEQLI